MNPLCPLLCQAASHPCHPSRMCSGRQSLFWPGIGFTEIKETLCGGQRASAGRQRKAALEAEWHGVHGGAGGTGQPGTWGRLHIQNTHGLVINTQPPHLEQEVLACWNPCPSYRRAWLPLGSGVIQCSRYALQDSLSAAQHCTNTAEKHQLNI